MIKMEKISIIIVILTNKSLFNSLLKKMKNEVGDKNEGDKNEGDKNER